MGPPMTRETSPPKRQLLGPTAPHARGIRAAKRGGSSPARDAPGSGNEPRAVGTGAGASCRQTEVVVCRPVLAVLRPGVADSAALPWQQSFETWGCSGPTRGSCVLFSRRGWRSPLGTAAPPPVNRLLTLLLTRDRRPPPEQEKAPAPLGLRRGTEGRPPGLRGGPLCCPSPQLCPGPPNADPLPAPGTGFPCSLASPPSHEEAHTRLPVTLGATGQRAPAPAHGRLHCDTARRAAAAGPPGTVRDGLHTSNGASGLDGAREARGSPARKERAARSRGLVFYLGNKPLTGSRPPRPG